MKIFQTFLVSSVLLAFSFQGFSQSLNPEESPALQALLHRQEKGEASKEFVSQVVHEAEGLRSKGLPAEPFLLKANEGIAKQASPKKISKALNRSKVQTELAGELFQKVEKKEGGQIDRQKREKEIQYFQRELMIGKKPAKVERLAEKKIQRLKKKDASQSLNHIHAEKRDRDKHQEVQERKTVKEKKHHDRDKLGTPQREGNNFKRSKGEEKGGKVNGNEIKKGKRKN
jgi:hypothetical protein